MSILEGLEDAAPQKERKAPWSPHYRLGFLAHNKYDLAFLPCRIIPGLHEPGGLCGGRPSRQVQTIRDGWGLRVKPTIACIRPCITSPKAFSKSRRPTPQGYNPAPVDPQAPYSGIVHTWTSKGSPISQVWGPCVPGSPNSLKIVVEFIDYKALH